jgi:Protein of unknown function (DUF1629)
MKLVFQAIDQDAFAFLQCNIRSFDGQERAVRWFCNVIRIIDALDEEKPEVRIAVARDGSKIYFYSPGDLVFKEFSS